MNTIRSIQPIGSYFPMDSGGFIVNPTSWSKIDTDWQQVLEQVTQAYQNLMGEHLLSVYVRGSVAKGEAIKGFSDVDTFALVQTGFSPNIIRWQTASFQSDLQDTLQQTFPFVQEIECKLATYNSIFLTPKLAMVLKTQALRIYGEHIEKAIPKFKIDRSIMLNYRWLKEDLDTFYNLPNADYTPRLGQGILKVLLRVGFELVMPQVGKFTNDLYLCYRDFAHYHPRWVNQMRQCLYWYLNPPLHKIELQAGIVNLGAFLKKAIL